jgi:hypothetical protein
MRKLKSEESKKKEILKKLLLKSKKDYKEGRVHSNEQIFKDVRKWLKEK